MVTKHPQAFDLHQTKPERRIRVDNRKETFHPARRYLSSQPKNQATFILENAGTKYVVPKRPAFHAG
jgi:hypothetical protein